MGAAWDALMSDGEKKPKLNPLTGKPMPEPKPSVLDTLTAPFRARAKLLNALEGPKKPK